YIECNNKPWKKLRHLRLDDVRLRAKGHARAVLRMITSSPNLQRLTIMNSKDKKALGTMKSGGDGGGSGFELLNRIEMKGVRGSDDELSLISWLLNSSPALEQIEIEVFDENLSRNVDSQIVNSVNGFRRVSSKVEINITSAI
ncbi:hypothetical protein LINGRAHAP2_LOCUS32655, partial [Linum grandiflorum]